MAVADELRKLQNLLYAENRRALLIILQGMDTSGKDGTIRHVMSGLTPLGDDLLCGWIATHRAAGVPTPEIDRAVRAGLHRTTLRKKADQYKLSDQ